MHRSVLPLTGRARQLLARAEQGARGWAPSPARGAPQECPNPISETVRTAVRDALCRGETHYTDRPGLLALRVAIAEGLGKRFTVKFEAEDMMVTCGVTEARFVALQQLLGPGAVIAAPLHAEQLEGAALLRRAQLVTVVDTNAELVYLASSAGEAECRAALAVAPAGAAILYEINEHRSRFHPGQLKGFAGRTITIGALGDESWRIGYLVSPAARSAGMREFKQALTICSTNLSQWAMLAALDAGEVAL